MTTPRAELVQKAKKLGIKNIAKKNMIVLTKQIVQKQSSKPSQTIKAPSKKPKQVSQKSKSQLKINFDVNTVYNSFIIVNELLDTKSPNQSVCVVQYCAGYSYSFYPTQISVLDEKRVIKEFKNFNKHYAPQINKRRERDRYRFCLSPEK